MSLALALPLTVSGCTPWVPARVGQVPVGTGSEPVGGGVWHLNQWSGRTRLDSPKEK